MRVPNSYFALTQAERKHYIKHIVASDRTAAIDALMIVYSNQTKAEQRSLASLATNGAGFDRNDARMLTGIAQHYITNKVIPTAQCEALFALMPKYWRQIDAYLGANAKSTKHGCVTILRHPTAGDWERCLMLARHTASKPATHKPVSDEWKRKVLKAQHSPIRTLVFTIKVELPYYSSVHFARHKFGVEHYVTSQRNDRQVKYDRALCEQGQTVSHIMDINAEALINMAHRRLCAQADPTTRYIMSAICREVLAVNPEFSDVLVPMCEYQARCPEFKPCGRQIQRKDCQPVQMQLDI